MLRKNLIFIFIILSIISLCLAEVTEKNSIDQIMICRDIVDRQPVGIDTVFTSDVEQIFCFTRIIDSTCASTISHVWYYNDLEMAKVRLNVKSSSFRTWSSKKIYNKWTGDWRIDVVGLKGEIIKSINFEIKPSGE